MKMYSVYDSKAQAYGLPFHQRTNGEALRSFADLSNDNQSTVSKHPEDYTLFFLGEFDETTGIVKSEATPSPLGKAIEYKSQDGLRAVGA